MIRFQAYLLFCSGLDTMFADVGSYTQGLTAGDLAALIFNYCQSRCTSEPGGKMPTGNHRCRN